MKTHFTARKAVTVAAGAAMAVMFVPVLTMPAMAAEPSPSASPSGSSAPAVTPPVVELAPSVLETSSSPVRPPSHLDIRKVLVNPDGVELSRRLEFTIAPNCNVGADPSVSSIPNTITLGVGDHENLHVSDATACDPQEIAPSDTRDYHWLAPSYSSTTNGDTRTVTITNTVAGNGRLTITKKVNNPDDVNIPESFTVTYSCGLDYNHKEITGTERIEVNESESVRDVPVGNVCTVTEEAPTGAPTDYSWTTVYSPNSFTMVHAGGTIEVQNTISRDTGTLTINKVLNAGGSGYAAPFSIFYSCASPEIKPTATTEILVTPGIPYEIKGIPTHQTCLVTESTPTVSVPGYTWSAPVVTGGQPTGEMTKAGLVVTVTNALTAIPAAGGGGGGGAVAAPAPVAVAVVTPSPVAVAPSASASEVPAPVNAALPATGAIPTAVNAGGGSAATDSSLPRWGFAFALLALVSVCIVAVRMQGSKS